jgi:hypothetical protein
MDIKAGDLVAVVKPTPCCGRADALGRVFTVGAVVTAPGRCSFCGAISFDTQAMQPNGRWIVLSRLQKIRPLCTPESIVERMTVKA